MVEPLFRFNEPLVPGQEVQLTGPEGHHAAAVRRMRVGEAIALTNGRGLKARGVVRAVAPKQLTVAVHSVETIESPVVSFTLVQAVAKGDRDELAVQAATELGAGKVVPWQADRSISKWDGKEEKNRERWQQIVDEAAKQALRPWFPPVNQVQSSKSLAKQIAESAGTFLVLDPTAVMSLNQVELSKSGEVALIVGPEGGITEAELALFETAGAKRVHLGSGILRTSTAGMAAISVLAAKSGYWD
jgi:16S rRNA (uracil1498-N3)-methyltransferase